MGTPGRIHTRTIIILLRSKQMNDKILDEFLRRLIFRIAFVVKKSKTLSYLDFKKKENYREFYMDRFMKVD